MKQLLILIITLIIVISAGIWEMSYLEESSGYFLSDINNIYQLVERNEYELAKNEADTLKDTWKDIRKTWALFIDDSRMDEIGDTLVSFVSYIQNQDTGEVKHSYKCLSNSVRNVVEFESLKPENIF